jgi:hypothetical protein
VVTSAFTLILFGSAFILCAFVIREKLVLRKTKFPVIACAEKMVNYVFEDLREEKAPNSSPSQY